MSNQLRMVEDTEGSSQSWTQIPGCCADCHDYEDLRNQLEPDCNVHMRGLILLNPSKNGHVDCVKACLADGIEIKPWHRAALFEAVKKGYVELTKRLLKAGANVNNRDKNKETALFAAFRESSVQCADLLLKAGADVNSKNREGETALFAAVRSQSFPCTDLLLKAGADVNVTDQYGDSVLFLDHMSDHIWSEVLNIIKMLLSEVIKVNVRNCYGSNALTHFLNCTQNTSTNPDYIKFAMLLLSAGETVDTDGRMKLFQLLNQDSGMVPVEVPEYWKPSAEISLKNICRETIRKHLLQMSDVNLFVMVPRLPLPHLMTSYLLYDVTLDDEGNNEGDNG